MKFIRTRAWLIRYRESLIFGVLAGMLMTNVYIIYQGMNTLEKVLDISKQIKESNQTTVDYVQCIALIHPDFRTEQNIQACVNDDVVPDQIRSTNSNPSTAPAPSTETNPKVRNDTTTSNPPEPPKKPEPEQPNIVQRIGEELTEIGQTLETVVKDIL